MDAERNYLLSIIQRPDEIPDATLERFWEVGFISLDEVSSGNRRELLATVQESASRGRATSMVLAAQVLGVDADKLLAQAEQVDPDAIKIYADKMLERGRKSRVRSAAERVIKDDLSSEQMLEELQKELLQIRSSEIDSKVRGIDVASDEFMSWLEQQQEFIKAGKKRVAFMWRMLDWMVPYLFPGNVVLLTAQTKVGKSSFAQQWFDVVLEWGFNGLYFHFEDPPEVMGLKRTARLMALHGYENQQFVGVVFNDMLTQQLSERQMGMIKRLNDEAKEWTRNGKQVWSAGWQISQLVRVWQMEDFNRKVDFVVIDYLGKATLTSRDIRDMGVSESRARDAELIKTVAEQTGAIVCLVQQENDDGNPFGTRQSAKKAQVHLSLKRERLGEDFNRALSNDGVVSVVNANLGATGDVKARFHPSFMVWSEATAPGSAGE